MNDPLVVATSITREFRDHTGVRVVLDAVSCGIAAGDRIAVTGPSGSGKSTLLNLLGGLDDPSRGSVVWPRLAGYREGNGSPPRHTVAFVFQAPSLLPALDVAGNVALPLMLAADDDDRDGRVETLLDALDLAPLARKFPAELSGGQAQRVAIARALIGRPRLLLADEPTGQLDHPTAQRVIDVLLTFLAEHDAALLLATHDAAVAGRLPQRWQLDHGRLTTTNEAPTCS